MTIVRLAEAKDVATFGGKAASLARAIGAALPVPGGFAVSWETVARIAAGDEASTHLLNVAFHSCGERVAVRSSAVGEDSADASFAGQHATILNITSVNALLEAVRTIHASAHTGAALEYRKKMNVAGEPRIAIVVQKMIDAEAAGVLFTRNPLTGADERVIESAFGLGESVVAGLVTPDRFLIARNGTILERTAGRKDTAIRYAPEGGTVEVEVEDPLRLSLTDEQLAELHALAARCEEHFGGPQDLEWAVSKAVPRVPRSSSEFLGSATDAPPRNPEEPRNPRNPEELTLYLLQSRPITRIAIEQPEPLTTRRFIGLGLAALLAPLNSTIIAVALPSIASEFQSTPAVVTRWAVMSYLMVSIVAQSPAGKLADLWGYSRVLTLGRAAFGIGALLAAVSPLLPVLGIGRIVMAIGGALAIPTVFAQLRNSVPPNRRGRVFGIFGAIMGGAAAVGPLIGGFLTSRYGWHSIFIVNVPVVLLSFLLEPPRAETRGTRRSTFDFLGGAILGIAVLLLVAAVETFDPLYAVATVAAVAAFVFRELRATDPVLDVRLFGHSAFAAGSAIVALQNLAMYSMLFLLPFFLGGAPAQKGRMLLMFTAAMVLLSPIGGRLSDAVGSRIVAFSGALIATAGAALFVTRGDAYLIASLILMGAGIGISTSPSQAAALSAISASQAGVASGALSTMRYVGGVIGSGLVALLAGSGLAHDNRLFVFPAVLLVSAVVALALPGRHAAR